MNEANKHDKEMIREILIDLSDLHICQEYQAGWDAYPKFDIQRQSKAYNLGWEDRQKKDEKNTKRL